MARPRKYPFDQLAIGDTVTVTDVPNRHALQVAKHFFHDRCVAELGYDRDELPEFAFTYDPGTRTATITRLPDGTTLRRGRPPSPTSRTSKRRAWTARVEQLDTDLQRYLLAQAARANNGLPVDLLPAQALQARCAALNLPGMARVLADFTTSPEPYLDALTRATLAKASKDGADAPEPAQP